MTKIYKNIKRHVNVLKGLSDVIASSRPTTATLTVPCARHTIDYLKDPVK